MCLSQDVIAHTRTHALLAGMNLDFDPADTGDDSALQLAFAGLIALSQVLGQGIGGTSQPCLRGGHFPAAVLTRW
jgi:hypothetical protein